MAAAFDGSLTRAEYRIDPFFGFSVPMEVDGVDPQILNPRSTWADPEAYGASARMLVGLFAQNFTQFEEALSPGVLSSAPGNHDG